MGAGTNANVEDLEDMETYEKIVGMPSTICFTPSFWANPQGYRLRTYHFKNRTLPCKGVVFLCHGYGANTIFEWFLPLNPGERHNQWKGSIVDDLTAAGYDVYTLDQQGFGFSDGARGLFAMFDSFDDLPKENIAFIKDVILKDAQRSKVPLFICGISMGGATAVRMSQMEPSLFRGMVLYAPMISLEKVKQQKVVGCITNKHLEPIAKTLSAWVPTLQILKPAKNTIHPLSEDEKNNDPMFYANNCRVRVGAEFMTITDAFMDGSLASVTTPFLVFHGVSDTFTDPLGSETLFKMASVADKTYLRVGPGSDVEANIWHNMVNEPGHEVVQARTVAWLAERAASE